VEVGVVSLCDFGAGVGYRDVILCRDGTCLHICECFFFGLRVVVIAIGTNVSCPVRIQPSSMCI